MNGREPLERVLVYHLDTELLGPLPLRSRSGPGDDEVGLLAHGRRRLAAEAMHDVLGLITAAALERSGEDDRLPRERAPRGRGPPLRQERPHPGGDELVEEGALVLVREVADDGAGDDGA